MREKTEERIKKLIYERVMSHDAVKEIIHQETRNLKVELYPEQGQVLTIAEGHWSRESKKIDLETLLRMLLEHLNLEVVTTEKSVKPKKKVKAPPPIPTEKQMKKRILKACTEVEKRVQEKIKDKVLIFDKETYLKAKKANTAFWDKNKKIMIDAARKYGKK